MKEKIRKIAILIVAAGKGTRLGGDIPKQFLHLGGKSILQHTIEVFAGFNDIDVIQTVIDRSALALYQESIQPSKLLLDPVFGGERRQDSVRAGLEALVSHQPDIVLIHDAARPFLPLRVIDDILKALEEYPGAIPVLPVTDTLKRADKIIEGHVERAGLFRAQTPQGFHFSQILAAHRHCLEVGSKEMTDDAAIAEAYGLKVACVEGSEKNFKITNKEDMKRAENEMTWEYRTGNGYDVHRLIPGDGIWLCGVEIPHDRKLEGHSDADVGLHALTDAILGGIGAGDIGTHFPPSDSQWKGAPSWKFLSHAADLVRAKGGKITHIDLTLICEAPKVGPHRPAMVARIAEILSLTPDRVSLKATTTERLGFTGRGEGIAAQATATIALPVQD